MRVRLPGFWTNSTESTVAGLCGERCLNTAGCAGFLSGRITSTHQRNSGQCVLLRGSSASVAELLEDGDGSSTYLYPPSLGLHPAWGLGMQHRATQVPCRGPCQAPSDLLKIVEQSGPHSHLSAFPLFSLALVFSSSLFLSLSLPPPPSITASVSSVDFDLFLRNDTPNPCDTNNGGCGDVLFTSCTFTGGSAGVACADIDECLVSNGGCGMEMCTNRPGAAPVCRGTGGGIDPVTNCTGNGCVIGGITRPAPSDSTPGVQ